MADRVFYVRAVRGDQQTNGLTFEEARKFVVDNVTEQLVRYFASECVIACGISKDDNAAK